MENKKAKDFYVKDGVSRIVELLRPHFSGDRGERQSRLIDTYDAWRRADGESTGHALLRREALVDRIVGAGLRSPEDGLSPELSNQRLLRNLRLSEQQRHEIRTNTGKDLSVELVLDTLRFLYPAARGHLEKAMAPIRDLAPAPNRNKSGGQRQRGAGAMSAYAVTQGGSQGADLDGHADRGSNCCLLYTSPSPRDRG